MIHPHPHIHLYAIGNALVDTEHHVSDEQLQALGIEKSRMTLIDAERRTELLRLLDGQPGHRPNQRVGGGSAGNTVVALAQLGGTVSIRARWPTTTWVTSTSATLSSTAWPPT